MLNAAGLPARRVVGVRLEEERRRAPLTAWAELWDAGGWVPIDPRSGETARSQELLPLAYGEHRVVRVEGASVVERAFAIKQSVAAEVTRAVWRSDQEAPLVTMISPLILSIDAQLVFQTLLLLPAGALVIAVIRQIIGVRTFGTFMPVLIALAFRETQLLLGVGLFIAIVAIGLVLRSYFNRLHLALVPRLSAVLAIVTVIMLAIAIVGAMAGVRLGLSLSLFPIVILTMTVESMSLIWDEYGAREALIRGSGSLFAAICAYLVISQDALRHLMFVFPELLLALIGLAIILGRYNGFTLHEYIRFRHVGVRS